MATTQLTKLTLKNFLASSEGLVDSRMFQHLFVKNEAGQERLIDRPHATVKTTLQKMAEQAW